MHLYRFNPVKLAEALKKFVGGQVEIKTNVKCCGSILRGEIQSYTVVGQVGNSRVLLTLNWLCELRMRFDHQHQWVPRPIWEPIKTIGTPFLDIPFTAFYEQPDEERLKMWGEGWGEVCKFFKAEDWTNLVKVGEEYKSYFSIHEKRLKLYLLIAASHHHTKKPNLSK
jgi:hypothetical protein